MHGLQIALYKLITGVRFNMQYELYKPIFRFKFWALYVQICLALLSFEAQSKPSFGTCSDYFETRQIVLLKADEILVHQSIQARILEAQNRKNTPVLIFDLDGTVYTIQSRILKIL